MARAVPAAIALAGLYSLARAMGEAPAPTFDSIRAAGQQLLVAGLALLIVEYFAWQARAQMRSARTTPELGSDNVCAGLDCPARAACDTTLASNISDCAYRHRPHLQSARLARKRRQPVSAFVHTALAPKRIVVGAGFRAGKLELPRLDERDHRQTAQTQLVRWPLGNIGLGPHYDSRRVVPSASPGGNPGRDDQRPC